VTRGAQAGLVGAATTLGLSACTALAGLNDVPQFDGGATSSGEGGTADVAAGSGSGKGEAGGHDGGFRRDAPLGHPADASSDTRPLREAAMREAGSRGSDASDAATIPDVVIHGDGSPCSPVGSGVIGAVGCPCTGAGSLACGGNDSHETLVCAESSSGLVWEGNGSCSSGDRCDTQAGQSQGTCEAVDPNCANASPGEDVCGSMTTVVQCGADLLTDSPVTTCAQPTPMCTNGSCGCPSGYTVANGACCTGPETGCGGVCVDTQTDNANCGSCNTVCDGTCTGGRCLVVLYSAGMSPASIAVAANDVFWGDPGLGTVTKVGIGGGAPTTIAENQVPDQMAANGSFVVWAGGDSVLKYPLGGGSVTTIASGQEDSTGLAVDDTDAYWTTLEIVGSSNLVKVSLTSGAPMTLETNQGDTAGVAVSSNSIYWIDQESGLILFSGLSGGTPTSIETTTVDYGLAVYGSSIFWTVYRSDSPVMTASLTGASMMTLAGGQDSPAAIAVDGVSVYWTTDSSTGIVAKVPISGGATTTLATGLNVPSAIAVDSTSVYWTNDGAGTVMKLTPK
jgi:hypothetical protein